MQRLVSALTPRRRSKSPTSPLKTAKSKSVSSRRKKRTKPRKWRGDMVEDAPWPDPRSALKPYYKNWDRAGASRLFMTHYAELGPEGIKAEFHKEVESYAIPDKYTKHAWFDARPTKNRINDVVSCLDHSRVLQADGKYINASWAVRMLGQEIERDYIITQMPLESTLEEFWRMNHDEEVRCIVLFVPDHEKLKKEQADYKPPEIFWPDKEGETKQFGNMTVLYKKTVDAVDPIFWKDAPPMKWTLVEVRTQGQDYGKTVRVGQIVPGKATPAIATVRQMLRLGRALDKVDYLFEDDCEPDNGLVVVVDDAGGIGWAPLFVVIDALCEALFHGRSSLSAFDVVHWIRRCRNVVMKNEDEYLLVVRCAAEFVYRAANVYAAEPRKFTDEFKKIFGDVEPPVPPKEKDEKELREKEKLRLRMKQKMEMAQQMREKRDKERKEEEERMKKAEEEKKEKEEKKKKEKENAKPE